MSTELSHASAGTLARRAARVIPGGVNSNVRLDAPSMFFARGEGAWLWDVDGNDYVDYLLGQGPALLGHAPKRILERVEEACRNGMVFGAQHELEVEAAERLVSLLDWAEMVRFGSTGTEMVQAALRLARASTGRRQFIRFEGHYHGWLDNVLLAPAPGATEPGSAGQLVEALSDQTVLPWNDAERIEAVLEEPGNDVAAILMEPVMLNAGAIEPRPGFLSRVRELCDRHGVLLIFDEVISGFRVALGGAAELYGVDPDLAVYGKALAAGWPAAALAGRADLMERFASREVNHSGTFNGNVMASAAVCATLELLEREPPYAELERTGRALMDGIATLGAAHSIPLRVDGLPSAFHVSFGEGDVFDLRTLQTLDLKRYSLLARELSRHGVWVAARGVWYVSTEHGDRELETTFDRLDAALRSQPG